MIPIRARDPRTLCSRRGRRSALHASRAHVVGALLLTGPTLGLPAAAADLEFNGDSGDALYAVPEPHEPTLVALGALALVCAARRRAPGQRVTSQVSGLSGA